MFLIKRTKYLHFKYLFISEQEWRLGRPPNSLLHAARRRLRRRPGDNAQEGRERGVRESKRRGILRRALLEPQPHQLCRGRRFQVREADLCALRLHLLCDSHGYLARMAYLLLRAAI